MRASRTHDQNAPRGVSVRRRHRAHQSRNDCHATAARAKSHAQAPHRPACAAATAARSTATGRLGRPAASSSRPSTLVGSGERKESSLRPLERLEGPRELIGGHVSGRAARHLSTADDRADRGGALSQSKVEEHATTGRNFDAVGQKSRAHSICQDPGLSHATSGALSAGNLRNGCAPE